MRSRAAVRVVSPLQWLIYPALIAIAGSVVLATPLRILGMTLPEPVLPAVLAFAWPVIRPSVLGAAVSFGLGIVLDLLWGGPLGLWPLFLVVIYGLSLLGRVVMSGLETVLLFLGYGVTLLTAFGLVWLASAALTGMLPSLSALFWQFLPTLLLFPAANWLIERFDDGEVRFL